MKLILATLIIFAFIGKSISQTMWVDENKNLYVNQALPIYLKVNTKSNPGDGKILKENAADKAEEIKPVYFPREGKNIIRTKTYPTKISADDPSVKNYVYVVYVDGTAPISSISYDGFGVFSKNDTVYLGARANIHLSSKDRTTPLEGTYFKTNDGRFSQYSKPFHVTQEGLNYIRYYAIDRVGNVESLKTEMVIADFSPPKCNIQYDRAPISKEKKDKYETLIFDQEVTVDIEATDNGSGVNLLEYSINKGEFLPYTEKIKLKATSPEKNSFHLLVRYNDNLGNEGIAQSKFVLNE